MNILITGHEGFIGKNLWEYLSGFNDVKLTGLDITSGFDITKDSLPKAIPSRDSIDVVIHLAGVGGVRESLDDPKKYWDINVEGTRKVLNYFKNQHVLVASSSSQYEPHLNPYAASKNIIENIPHKKVCFMRFHTVYSDKPRKGMFFDKLFNNKLKYTTTHERDFIHVSDICKAIDKLIECSIIGPVDIGTGHSIKICNIAPGLPIVINTVGERQKTCANLSKMKSLGWKPEIMIETFLKENGYEYNS